MWKASTILAAGAVVALVVWVYARRKVDATVSIGEDFTVKRSSSIFE